MTPTTSTVASSNDNTPRARRTYSAQEKTDLLALFAETKLSAADFCREMDVNPATFSLWRKQSESGEANVAVDFAEVRVAPGIAATMVTITLPSGASVSVPMGTDPAWLGQLVRNLR